LSLIPVSLVLGVVVFSGRCGNPDRASSSTQAEYTGLPCYNPDGFERMGPVQPGDWLDRFPEDGQTFLQYRKSNPPRARGDRKILVLQPLGPFTREEKAVVKKAAAFARLYFQCPVRINRPAPLPPRGRRTRRSGDGRVIHQYQTRWIFQGQLFPRLPEDAVAFLGVTMQDIYPSAQWNYVFGEAFLEDRVGVYSLARYFPEFRGEKNTPEARRLALVRTFKVLAHETAHMFGLQHCIAYRCVVNGSNSLEESDRQPLHLCPVDLKKLQWNLGFDLTKRYRELHAFYLKHALKEEADFVADRLKRGGR